MAIRKKTAILQHLDEIGVFIEDTGIVSEYFNITDIPNEIPIGKSSMLLMGSRYLKENVVIKVELLDNSGNAVYLEPVFDYTESGGVRVGIEVYEDTPPGTAMLTVLGELDPNKVDFAIPSEFIGVYNVKFSRPLTINKTIPNDRPIRFHKRPTILVSEIIKGQITPTAATTGSLQQTVGTIEGVPASNTEGNTFSIDSANYGEIPTYTDEVYGFNPIGNFDTFEVPNSAYTFTIDNANFSSSMIGGTLTIDSPVANPSFITSSQHLVTPYSARISKVINKKTIEVQKPFGIYNSGSGQYEISAMNLSSYSINWPQESEFVSSSVNFKSFADIGLSNMRTFSGDVYRVSGYVKNNGPFGNWQKVIDTPVESPELLIDVLSMTGTTRVGYFKSDSVVSTYWNAKARTGGAESSTTLQTYSEDEYLSDSIFISGSGANMSLDDQDEWISIELKPQYSMSFDENTDYTIRAKLVVDNRTGSQEHVKAVAHMSGSAFGMSQNHGNIGYGRPIGVVSHRNAAGKVIGTNDTEFEAVFTPDNTGTAVLQIRFTGGYWHMSNLSIRPNSETNFSPEFIRLIAPVPPLQTRPDYLDFAFEFYDVNNNKSQTVVTTVPDNADGVRFEGENLNIFGDDNTIAGSLFIGGETTGSGIQMGGTTSNLPETGEPAGGSGFIRSVNYQGFTSSSLNSGAHTGWMIYSGSVLPGSGDEYAGVGLELAGESGSFRFGTNPSRFEVVADTFFVGNANSQFISGSGGIIEISSSAFHLSSSGDVFVSGSITATSGNIGDWTISGGDIVGANITMDANSSRIYKTDANGELNGFYMDFTPGSNYYVRFGTDFAVSSSGTLIAEGAVIEGVLTSSQGLIADWSITPGVLSSVTSGKYTGMSTAGDTRFFAGAASLTASGSAPFNVKATGDITGSSVQFIGGSIGGFTLSPTEISSSGLLLKSSGQITGSQVLLTGGKIGGFNIDSDHLFDSSENLQLTGSTGNIVAKAGTIGGWTLGASQISSSNLILDSTGLIETSNFETGISGWRISDSGEAEFENATVRGTLSSVTFEKQSVNAVGGQLWIANSSAITGSSVSNSAVTMSLVNASGFTANEYLLIKKVTPTGFNEEIIKVVSSSIDDTDTGAGKIMVTRGENSSTAVNYDLGQVVVSTGKEDTGYIKLNANPSDTSTPYIDIIERTGSAYPDFALKARLGDLSGLSSGLVGSNPGFGLFSENVFLTGKITATSGQIGGFAITSNAISSSNSDLILKDSGQITGSSVLFDGGKVGGWKITSSRINSPTDTMRFTSSNPKITMGAHTFGNGPGIQLGFNSGKVQFYAGNGSTSYLEYHEDNGLDIKTAKFKLDTANFDVDSTAGLLTLGSNPTLTSGTGVYMKSTGEFRMGDADGNINFVDGSFNVTGSDLSINVTQLNIDTPTFELSSPHVSMSLGASRQILLDGDGGTGGVPIFKLDGGEISASNFFVSTAGDLTASNANFQGVVSASEGNIAGWSILTGSMESNDIRIQSEGVVSSDGSGGAGFYIADSYGNDVVNITSGSLYEIGAATDEAQNDSFEVLQAGWDTAGYHVGNAASPLAIPSWSFSSTGPVSHSITKRTGAGFEKFNAAVLGNYTFDVVRPGYLAPSASLSASNALVSASYAVAKAAGADENSYELTQIVSASSQASDTWVAGNVVSFAFVGKMSHSLAGAGYDRGLQSQKYKVDYWTGSEWKTFIPEKTGSDGFGKFDLSSRYTSVKASNQLPASTSLLKIVISGSINSDITFKSATPIYEELELDPIWKYLKDNDIVPDDIEEEERNVADDSAKYPYTELTFDNFRLIQDQPRIQISQAGFLMYQSENSYLRMTPSKIDMRSATDGGMAFGSSVTGNASMGGLGVRGKFAAPKLQAWDADPNTIEAYSFSGNTDEYARGNHAHELPFSTVRDVISGQTLLNFTSTGIDDNATETAITIGSDEHVTFVGNIIVAGTVDGRDIAADGTKLDGIEASADVTDTANVTAAGALMDSEVDADIKTLSLPASTTISAFGATLVDDAAASNARTTLGLGSIAELSTIDISANTNLAASTGITLTGDTLTTNDGQIVHDNLSGFVADEHVAHSGVSIIAGTGMTGGGAIDSSKTLNVIGGTGITANADDIAVSSAQTSITSIYATDLAIGEDAQTRLDFGEANKIRWYAGNQLQMQLSDGVFQPVSDSDVDLGTTGVRWKDAFADSITITANASFGGTVTADKVTVGHDTGIEFSDGGTIKVAGSGDLEIYSAGGDLDIPVWLRMRASSNGTITGAWKNDASSKLHLGGDCTQTDYTLKIDATPLTAGSLYTSGNATFAGVTTKLSNANAQLWVGEGDGASDIYFSKGDTGDEVRLSKNSAGNLDILTNGGVIHLNVDGTCGIGTGAPAGILHVRAAQPNVVISNTTQDGSSTKLSLIEKYSVDGWLGGYVKYNGSANELSIGTIHTGTTETDAITIPRDGSGNATFAGTISNTGLHTVTQTADHDGIRFRGYDDSNSYYGKIGITDIGYTQIFAEGNRSIDIKSGRQIRFFTSTDNSTYNNSVNFNSDGSSTFTGTPLKVSAASSRITIDRTANAGVADLRFATNDAETNGCWAMRMNPDGSTNTTPSLAIEKWTGTDARVVEFNNDLSTDFFGDVIIPATKKLLFDGGDHTYISEFTSNHLGFFTGGTEALRFTDSQNAQFAGNIHINNANAQLKIEEDTDNDYKLLDMVQGGRARFLLSDGRDLAMMEDGGGITIGSTADPGTNKLWVAGNSNFAGNITLTGTVDGRDVAADGTKLDTCETNSKDDQTITAGAGLTGGGSGDTTLNVIGGTGITVNADDVALATGHIRNVDHSAVSVTAGSGLTGGGTIAATRTLNVGAGTAITVAADTVSVTADSIGDTQLTFNTGQHLTTSSAPSFAGLTSTEDIVLSGTGDSIYNTFVTGMFGTGWQIDYGTNGSFLEVDNIMVRNTLRTHIFQKDVVKATNGYLYVSDSGVINGSSGTTGTGTVSFTDDKSATFETGDQLWYKDVNPDTGTVVSVKFTMTDDGTADTPVADATQYAVTRNEGDLSTLVAGGTAVRISGGSLLLDASSTAAPYMDVIDNSGNMRVRVGQVKSSSPYDKYGILGQDASGNRVFEISEVRNEIAGWTLNETSISKSNISLNADTPSLRVTDGTSERTRVGDLNGVGGYSTSQYGVIGFQAGGTAATDVLFELSDKQNIIAGWEISGSRIHKYSEPANGGLEIDADGLAYNVYTGSASDNKIVQMGKLTADSNTTLLIHSNTVNNSSVFVDSGVTGHTVNTSGDPVHSNNFAKFGTTSMQFDGTGDYLSIADHADFDFGTGDFTIDFWAKASVANTNAVWIGRANTSTGHSTWFFRIESATVVTFAHAPTETQKQYTYTVGTSEWKHYAAVRSSGTTTIYVNGTSIGSFTDGNNYDSNAGNVYIGARQYSSGITQNYNGYIDELRISKGIARWTAAFTPPKSPNIGGNFGIRGKQQTGAELFKLGEAGNEIAGWTISPSTITGGVTTISSAGYIGLTATSYGASGVFIDGQSAARQSWVGTHGKMLWTGAQLQVYGNAGNTKVFETTNTGATIGGWDLTASSISGGVITIHNTGYIGLTATSYGATGIFIDGVTTARQSWAGTHGKMLWTGTALEIYGNGGSTKVFETTDTGATIGGWSLTTSVLKSDGDGDIRLNAGNKKITITSHTFGNNGIQLDHNSGTPRLYVGNSSDRFIRYEGGVLSWQGVNTSLSTAGVFTATEAVITGDITCDTLTANTDGEIAGWEIDSAKISKNNVSIIQGTAKTGLDITDGTDSILTVAATQNGMTDINALTGSFGASSPSNEWIDHKFETATTGVLNNSYWTQETSNWPDSGGAWSYDQTLAEIGDTCASFAAGMKIHRGTGGGSSSFDNTYQTSFYRDFTTFTNVYTTLSAGIKAHGWKYYGDAAKVDSFVEMQLSASSDGGTTWLPVGKKTVNYTATKFTKVGHKFKPSNYNKVRVRFRASVIAAAAGKAEYITIGGFAVDGFYMSNINASIGGGTQTRKKPLVELTQEGLLVFSSKDEYMQLNEEGFTLKGPINATSIDVEGAANVTGPIIAQDQMIISGSLNVQEDIAVGFGTDSPESKVHVRDSFGTPGSTAQIAMPKAFAIGEEASFYRVPEADYSARLVADGSPYKHAGAVKADYQAFISNNPDTGEYGRSAAFLSTPLHDSYGRVSNHLVYGEMHTSAAKGYSYWANNDQHKYEMSGSVAIGDLYSWNTSKTMTGMSIRLRYGPSNTSMGDSRQTGIAIHHGHADDHVGTSANDLANSIQGSQWYHHGIRYVKQGIYNVTDPDTVPGGTIGGESGIYVANGATGQYGPASGYGIFVSGDSWKSYFGGKVGIADTTPSFPLDVTGEIRATGNITAYSDIRDKTNIVQITGAVDMIKAIRGVRFDWKDAYKKDKVDTETGRSGRIDMRQIGVIAQEVEKVLPELVLEDNKGRKNVTYTNLTAVLVEALKEQNEQIEDLKERIKKLENE